jgi:predicted glycoside hydrolase/deacetylase ChbG (UPF0249 family)
MHMFRAPFPVLFVTLSIATLHTQSTTIAERLGYPAESKLLIIHADDLAVAHSVDVASFDALDRGVVSSASIMVPCPWITEVADYAKAHPDADLGLHLTLTSEWKHYRWGSVESRDKVPSLFDPAGTLWSESTQVGANARPQEVEREVRAQIERAMSLGIRPTHLDTHMGSLFATRELFATFARVAHEYQLPFIAVRDPKVASSASQPLRPGDVLLDAVAIATPDVRPEGWKDFYLNTIASLKPGLTELIVHLGRDDAELRAVTTDHDDYGSAWRQRDYDVIVSPGFSKALQDNHVIVVKWKDLQKLVRQP